MSHIYFSIFPIWLVFADGLSPPFSEGRHRVTGKVEPSPSKAENTVQASCFRRAVIILLRAASSSTTRIENIGRCTFRRRITLLRPSLQGPFLAGSKILSPPGERSGTIVTSDGHRYAEMQKLSLAIFIKTKLSLLFIYDLFMTAAGCACWRRSGRPWTRCAGAVHRPRESG